MNKRSIQIILTTALAIAIYSPGGILGETSAFGQNVDKIEKIENITLDFSNDGFDVKFRSNDGARPRLGVYSSDLCFSEAYERHYPNNYGIKITGVTKNSNAERAGLVEGDILMRINSKVLYSEDQLITEIRAVPVNGEISVDIWRNGDEMTLSAILAPSAEELEAKIPKAPLSRKDLRKKAANQASITIQPIYLEDDFAKLRSFLDNSGFNASSRDYQIYFGVKGAIPTGKKGYFATPQFYLAFEQQKVPNVIAGVASGSKEYKLFSGIFGVGLDKKFAFISPKLVVDAGCMVGFMVNNLAISRTDGLLTWDSPISSQNSLTMNLTKVYAVGMPTVGLRYALTKVATLHASMGYAGSFAFREEWMDLKTGFTMGGTSPSAPSGKTYSLGVEFVIG